MLVIALSLLESFLVPSLATAHHCSYCLSHDIRFIDENFIQNIRAHRLGELRHFALLQQCIAELWGLTQIAEKFRAKVI